MGSTKFAQNVLRLMESWAPLLGFMFYNPFSIVQNNVQDMSACFALREWICNHVTVVAPYKL
eukprot:12925145-Prorocentrum_lima.AAC.1